MKVTRFHHVSVNTNGTPLDDLAAFYRDVLGLDGKARPDIPGVPGHWHVVGDQELHLVGAPPRGTPIDPTGTPFLRRRHRSRRGGGRARGARHRVPTRHPGRRHGADLDQ